MAKKQKAHRLGAPGVALRGDPNHRKPVTRRDFLAQGFLTGTASVFGSSVLGLFANPKAARAALSPEYDQLKIDCGIAVQGAGKIPFIGFDLAGGANIAASNVLVGGQGGQMDFLSTQGYSRMGLPGDMIPGVAEVTPTLTSNGDHTDTSFGLAFHSDSAFLRGMLQRVSPEAIANTNGAVIPARSDNDTGTNPHNPMYGIYRAGADGELLTLIGSENSESGGNSMAPPDLIDVSVRPTKVDRPSDVTGLVDTGKLVGLLDQQDAVAVMESIERLSWQKVQNRVQTEVTADEVIKDLVRCGYIKSADLTDRYGNPQTLNPSIDPLIVGPTAGPGGAIFSQAEYDDEREFRKAASVMKMVINGFAGAGTIEMGGYDYHGGRRAEGEIKDFRAGNCMGACIEYAHRLGVPLMMYVFSDGSVSSNGAIDDTVEGRGKGEWASDNSTTAAAFFMVYNPAGRPQLIDTGLGPERHRQIGYFRADGSVETGGTPAANNVNLLVETVVLNYMALHGQSPGDFRNLFPNTGLGNDALMESLTAFQPIVNGTIGA
ncbi:MAG: hypothetical protein AAF438_08815 [Pseudomonadota bacterium]